MSGLSGVGLAGAILSGIGLSGTVLPGVGLAGAILPGIGLAGTVLPGVGLSSTVLSGIVLTGAILPGIGLPGTVLVAAVVGLLVGSPIIVTAAFAGQSSVYHFQFRTAHGAFLFFAGHSSSRPAVFGSVCFTFLPIIIQLNLPHFKDGGRKSCEINTWQYMFRQSKTRLRLTWPAPEAENGLTGSG